MYKMTPELKERAKLDNPRNFHLFECKIKQNISFKKLQNFWVAKGLIARHSF